MNTDDIRALSLRGAGTSGGPVDVAAVRRHGAGRRQRKRIAIAVAPLAALAIAAAMALPRPSGRDMTFAPADSEPTKEATAPSSPESTEPKSPEQEASAVPTELRWECPDGFEEVRRVEVSDEGIDVTLEIDSPVSVGDPPDIAIINHGDILITFVPHTQVDRWSPGGWERVLDPVSYAVEPGLPPGERIGGRMRLRRDQPLDPGCYRVLRWVYLPGSREIELSRLFVVTP